MSNSCALSQNTQAYIEQYRDILHTMIEQMSAVELSESLSGSFIEQMIPHHRAAIDMSENLLRYTSNIPLQNIALNIISSQKESIENMTAAFSACQSFLNTPQEVACYQMHNEAILKTMFHEMTCAGVDNNIDANFMRQMIPHHRGAVRMSENALRYPLCPELVPLLNAIITSQKRASAKCSACCGAKPADERLTEEIERNQRQPVPLYF